MNSPLSIQQQLMDGLSHLILADEDEDARFADLPGCFRADAELFDGWEPMDNMFGAGTESALPNQPVDCITAYPVDHDGGISWTFIRIKTLSPKDWRGRLHAFPPHAFDFMVRGTQETGKARFLRLPIVRRPSGHFLHPQLKMPNDSKDVMDFVTEVLDVFLPVTTPLHETAAACMTHRRTAYWNVVIGYPSFPRARLATDITGIRSFFEDREVGKRGRKDALLHWVSAHWRKKRPPSADDHSWVRQHMRGKREFSWNGTRCIIEPSIADMALAKAS